MRDYWHKDAIIYSVEVETFKDGNGDGIGDFKGLTEQLSYIAGLGFNTLWLLPFHPTPFRDDGYDITDYFSIDSRLGTLGDFVQFIHEADSYGLRVIIDLVVNHTSNQHSWFQQARSDPNSYYRNFYVWSKEKPKTAEAGVVFPGVQKSTWTFDRVAGEYYFHRFYKFQPDLNISNPEVRAEICRVIGLWLQLGVSGFRVDAAPFLIELKGMNVPDSTEAYQYLREFRDFLSWRTGDAILLAEANVEVGKLLEYFGDGNKMHMLFNFILNQYLFLALAREDASPLLEGMLKAPAIPESCQWAIFLRNHDEIDLGRLTEGQREEVFARFGPEKRMQLYGRGLRRRLAPMLGGDLDRIKMAYSLMFSLPGTPVIRYGEEIGMGDDLSLQERNSIRTPMQWSNDANAGFSTAPSTVLFRPVIADGPFGYKRVNVELQRRQPNSLINFIERCIRMRKECPQFGRGSGNFLENNQPSVFTHYLKDENGCVLAAHNLSRKPCEVEVDISDLNAKRLIDLLREEKDLIIKGKKLKLPLDGYDHRWFRVA